MKRYEWRRLNSRACGERVLQIGAELWSQWMIQNKCQQIWCPEPSPRQVQTQRSMLHASLVRCERSHVVHEPTHSLCFLAQQQPVIRMIQEFLCWCRWLHGQGACRGCHGALHAVGCRPVSLSANTEAHHPGGLCLAGAQK